MLIPNIDLRNKTILFAGAAGAIDANLAMELLRSVEPLRIVGLDSMNDYYDVSLKEYRLKEIGKLTEECPVSQWIFVKGDIADKGLLEKLFAEYGFDYDFEAHKQLALMQPGDVPVTYADTSDLERDFGFKPDTSLREGLRRFAQRYSAFYCCG